MKSVKLNTSEKVVMSVGACYKALLDMEIYIEDKNQGGIVRW